MMTPRQELIKRAAARLDLWRRKKISFITPAGGIYAPLAHHAIEAIINECLACKPDTLGATMLEYYLGITVRAVGRLIYAVDAAASCDSYWYEHKATQRMIYSYNGHDMIKKRAEIKAQLSN